MDEQTRWVLELIDQVTAPARQIRASLASVTAAQQNLSRAAAKSAVPRFTESFKGSFATIRSGAQASQRSFAGLESGLDSLIGKVGAYAIAAKAASMAWSGLKTFAETALEAAAFKENALISFEVLLKNKDAAAALYKEAEKFAAVTPFGTQDVLKLYQDLLTSGFKTDKKDGKSEISVLAETIGNIAAARGMDASLISRLTLAIGQIKGAGKLRAQEMNQLKEAGLGQALVYEEVAKILGKKASDIPKMMEQGLVDSQTALFAIVQGVGKTYGGLMDRQADTLTGLWSTLKSRPFEILSSLADTPAFDTLKQFIKALNELFNPSGETAGAMKGFMVNVVQRFFDLIFGWAKDAEGKITPKSLQAGLDRLGQWFSELWARIEKGYNAFSDIIGKLYQFGEAIWPVVEFVIQFGQGVTSIQSALLEWGPKVFDTAMSIGKSIIDGIITAIIQGTTAVTNSLVSGPVQQGYEAAKKFLGISSPSKLFAGLGENIALGMAQGIRGGAGAVGRAALDMLPSPTGAAGPQSPTASSLAGAKGSITIGSIEINIQGSSNMNADDIKRAALEGVSEALEDMGFSLGVYPK